jgi:ABC-type lipoprotein release transport system permease subunit
VVVGGVQEKVPVVAVVEELTRAFGASASETKVKEVDWAEVPPEFLEAIRTVYRVAGIILDAILSVVPVGVSVV